MPPKRKRIERASTDGGRPSPHRPSDTFLGRHDRDDMNTRHPGGRGGRSTRRGDRRESYQGAHQRNQTPVASSPSANRPAASSQTPQPPAAVTRQARAPSPLPTPVPSNYCYDILSDDKISNWAESGRQKVIQHGVQSRDDVDITELSCLFQEFTRSVLDGRLPSTDAGACIKEIIGPESSEVIKDSFAFEPHTLFLDTVATVVDSDSPEEYPHLRKFLDATGVSHQAMRETLEVPLLNQLGLIRDSFAKLGIRHATNLLYRQANYNLLREETEGYSKLITELFTTSSSAPPTTDAVQATFEKIKALIGTFDLDVGRVLDVTLDVFAAVLIKQFRFFIKLLRVSSWWPRDHRPSYTVFAGGLPGWALPDSIQWQTSEEDEMSVEKLKTQRDVLFWERARQFRIDAYFELGGRQLSDSEREALELASDDHLSESPVEHLWKKMTKTLPPQGNKTAAQLLGFKLRFYASEARDEDDVLPANLLYLAALLIKVGFISLCDLYPHLWPLDEHMDAVREKKTKELEEKERASRPGGGMNALMSAGALPDDTMPAHMSSMRSRDNAPKPGADPQGANSNAPDDKPKLPEPMEQKIALVLCLLTIGALPEALFMLGRFPWMIEASSEVLDRIHRILNHSVDKVYKESQPVRPGPMECPSRDMATVDQTGAPKGTVKLGKLTPRRPLRWPFPDRSDMNDNQHYRFYWDEWADNVPVCQTVDDIFTLCGTLLNLSGVNIGKDETLIAKLSSIGAKSLTEDDSQENKDRWHDLLRRLLVPSLSLTSANSATVNAVWALLRTYPTQVRYNVYAEWHEGQISRLPAIKSAFARTRLETLSTMKRLSLTNLSDMAKSLAKTSYSSPGVVFKVALDQIESYANLIDAFVECAKYFTDLAYDVLVWSLMNSLGGKNRSRTQETSVLLTSKWLQALSRFAGRVFRRYTVLSPTPVIRYVDDQLFKGNSTDLIILKELISSMGGVVPTLDFTDDQIMAMSGGETLRRQTLINVHDKRFDSVKSAQRLLQSLVDSKLAGRLLVNIVQYRQAAIYKTPEDEAHIKFLSSMVDDSHQILDQYLDLLRTNLDPSSFDNLVPRIDRLLGDFGIEVGLAFLVSRPSLSYQLMSREEQQNTTQPPKMGQDDGDVAMADGPVQASQPTPTSSERDDKMQVDKKDATPATPTTQGGPRMNDLFVDVLEPIIDTLVKIKEPSFWQAITPEFFAMFWTLQLGDLFVPEEWYQKEEDRAYAQAKEILRDRSDMSRPGMTRKEERHKALTEIVVNLSKEKGRHKKTFTRNKFYMIRRFKSWFPNIDQAKPRAVADAVLEQCLLPRLMLSASDAEYCHRVIRFLHDFACPGFKLMCLYERLFNANRLRSIIFTCTVREAEHFSRFLKCVLSDLSRWHKDKAVYEKDALVGSQAGQKERSLPGFALTIDEDGKPTSFVEHDQFRDMLYGWHRNLNTALKSCLGGMEWMHIRNAITVLKSVLDFFPAVDFMAQQFTKQLKTITDRESATKPGAAGEETVTRVDLSVAAQSTLSELQKRKPKWVMVQGFRPNISGEPQSESSPAAPNLRANAPEFRPGGAAKAPNKNQPAEDEDGEVKDGDEVGSQPPTQPGPPVAANATKDTLPPRPGSAKAGGTNIPQPLSAEKVSQRPIPIHQHHGRNSPSPAAGANSVGRRSDGQRPTSLPHGLPSRPNVPLPTYFPGNRFEQMRSDHREGRDARTTPTRDARDPRHTREQRDARDRDQKEPPHDTTESKTPDPARLERPRDLPGPDRRAPEHASPRDPREARRPRETQDPRQLDQDRTPRSESSRRTETKDREPHTVGVGERPRVSPNGRAHDGPGSGDAAPATPTPAPPSKADKEGLSMNPARAALLQGESKEKPRQEPDRARDGDSNNRHPEPDRAGYVNPARAALIGNGRPQQDRQGRGDVRDRGPRAHSPRRRERIPEQPTPHDAGSRDDRHGRTHPPAPPPPMSAPSDQRLPARENRTEPPPPPPPPPAGGRGNNRVPDRDLARVGDGRHPPATTHNPPPRSTELDHGGRGGYQDQNYGRLNPIPSVGDTPQGPPSGPRGRGRPLGHRVASGPPASTSTRSDGRFSNPEVPRGHSPELHPPTGPASSGRGRRGPYEPSANAPGPVTPGAPSHQDRSRPGPPGPPGPSPASSFGGTPRASSGVHPDRMNHIVPGAPPPPHGQPHGYGRPPMRQGSDRGPPSGGPGPRSVSSSFPGPSPSDVAAPMGPSAPDRLRSGGRRQIAGINSMLQQAQATMSDQTRAPRRVSQRATLAGSDVQILTGGSPVSTPTKEDPPRRDEERAANGDHARDERGRRERERSERSGRSRRSSRERDREGERPREREREREPEAERGGAEKDPRYRERRAASGANPPAERESRRSSTRDSRHAAPARPEEWNGRRESSGRVRDDGRPPRDDAARASRDDAGRASRDEAARAPRDEAAGRSRDDRREREERVRKRRSEDGAVSSEREKRVRR